MTHFPRVAVIGSRGFAYPYVVERFVYLLPKSWTIVSGGARGVDTWAYETAKHHTRHVEVYNADWKKFGKYAGFIRNNEIVKNSDVVVAFWDGSSKGTRHSVQLARNLNKPVFIIRTTNND